MSDRSKSGDSKTRDDSSAEGFSEQERAAMKTRLGTQDMALSLDSITLGVPERVSARSFYTTVLSSTATAGQEADLDLHGTGRFALNTTAQLAADAGMEPATSGFRGYVLTYIVNRPAEVETVMDTATEAGAEVLLPAKKALFGSFSGVFRAPDGSIWKLAAATNKNTGVAGNPPQPTETTIILGVAKPKASKAFYEALGMIVDRDYGNKYVDFQPRTGSSRLCLMERGVLAKDAGVDRDGDGFQSIAFNHSAGSREEVDAILRAAASAGGQIAVDAAESQSGFYSGYFVDPDGFLWMVSH